MAYSRRWITVLLISLVFLISLLHTKTATNDARNVHATYGKPDPSKDQRNWWARYVPKHPVKSMIALPSGKPAAIPQIQFDFSAQEEDSQAKARREERRDAVKEAFLRSWKAYKDNAWMGDEVGPMTGKVKSTFGGWGATVVDSLDTLWIMGLKNQFNEAVEAASTIDFSYTETKNLNVFETTIRYLGGFLAAYDISEGAYPVLLEKAVEVGDLLYVAFDTPNRLPVLRWEWTRASNGEKQVASDNNIIAELGSLSMEFTRLTQLTNDPKYFDAIQRITDVLEKHQDSTKIPGLWPLGVDARKPSFSKDHRFTFGAMADSLYEYLPKEHLMLGGRTSQYQKMYEKAIKVAREEGIFFRPKSKDSADVLLSGNLIVKDRKTHNLQAEGQHLTCFVGGMVAMGAKIFNRPDELEIGRKLTEGCIWAYRSTPSGIMPEVFSAVPCKEEHSSCAWKPRFWFGDVPQYQGLTDSEIEAQAVDRGFVPGFLTMSNRGYYLRPEAIESVFILYRITGDKSLQEKGWDMFAAIDKYTRTEFGHGAIDDVTSTEPNTLNQMESFWTGETLKYFYLLFSEPDLVSLDRYVFNTEAHPFLRPE